MKPQSALHRVPAARPRQRSTEAFWSSALSLLQLIPDHSIESVPSSSQGAHQAPEQPHEGSQPLPSKQLGQGPGARPSSSAHGCRPAPPPPQFKRTMLGDGTASPVPEGAGKEHAKGASCGRDSPCSPADTQSSSTPSTREQQPRCVAAQPGVGFALRVLGGMVGAVPSGTQEERAARRRAEAAAAEAAAAAAREARAAASREAARGARVIAVSRSSGRGGGARASRHTANTPRVVSWQGDWQCACGSVHSMYRECRTCGGSKPCWWVLAVASLAGDALPRTAHLTAHFAPHLPLPQCQGLPARDLRLCGLQVSPPASGPARRPQAAAL